MTPEGKDKNEAERSVQNAVLTDDDRAAAAAAAPNAQKAESPALPDAPQMQPADAAMPDSSGGSSGATPDLSSVLGEGGNEALPMAQVLGDGGDEASKALPSPSPSSGKKRQAASPDAAKEFMRGLSHGFSTMSGAIGNPEISRLSAQFSAAHELLGSFDTGKNEESGGGNDFGGVLSGLFGGGQSGGSSAEPGQDREEKSDELVAAVRELTEEVKKLIVALRGKPKAGAFEGDGETNFGSMPPLSSSGSATGEGGTGGAGGASGDDAALVATMMRMAMAAG